MDDKDHDISGKLVKPYSAAVASRLKRVVRYGMREDGTFDIDAGFQKANAVDGVNGPTVFKNGIMDRERVDEEVNLSLGQLNVTDEIQTSAVKEFVWSVVS